LSQQHAAFVSRSQRALDDEGNVMMECRRRSSLHKVLLNYIHKVKRMAALSVFQMNVDDLIMLTMNFSFALNIKLLGSSKVNSSSSNKCDKLITRTLSQSVGCETCL